MSELSNFSNQLADAVERAGKSIVMVNGRERQPASGIVFGADLILTADHVLEREDNLSVRTHDGRTVAAQFAGRDPSTDLAVLKAPGLNLPAIETAQPARVGNITLAVGRPDGDGLQASLGAISLVSGPVKLGHGAQLDGFIRTDATPYPGFSGGPLIDAGGAAYGVVTTGLLRGGEAIAIPMSIALRVAQTLAEKGSIKRGFIGVVTQQVKLPAAQRTGANETGLLVMKVEEGAPAEKAGVMVGDILVSVDGKPVSHADELLAALAGRAGQSIPVQVLRGGTLTALQVEVGERK
ncbi:MAG TPA: trypsin-like peptidase domain-containing protein [Thermoflexales bacterium]|nr:trypsin-like peptidase domain-containing protein [Thermoflexales bacterium]HQW34756.1 trypsin-like peptidase domain-containing protein [Thermoflexales bacterium]HQZ23112.1 trypsin-like peptidase domain-containing protein [Thermoflexales bacterium]